MHNITTLLPLIDHYASFTRVTEPWDQRPGTTIEHETVSGLVVRLKEAWDDSQGIPLYQGVEVHFDDASVLLIKPSDTWRLESWGDLHEEAMVMLSVMDEAAGFPDPSEDDGALTMQTAAGDITEAIGPEEEPETEEPGGLGEEMYCYATKDGRRCGNQDHWTDPDMLLRTGYEGHIPEFTGHEHDEDPQP